jgi:hypothetical protein
MAQTGAQKTFSVRPQRAAVHFYQTTRRNNPKDRHLHTQLSENLKSSIILGMFKMLHMQILWNVKGNTIANE